MCQAGAQPVLLPKVFHLVDLDQGAWRRGDSAVDKNAVVVQKRVGVVGGSPWVLYDVSLILDGFYTVFQPTRSCLSRGFFSGFHPGRSTIFGLSCRTTV
jgi:hypothetical protein